MGNSSEEPNIDGVPSRFPVGTLLWALLPALAATGAVILLFARSPKVDAKSRSDGMVRIGLSQKNAAFVPIPHSAGGATGEVLFAPTGPALRFRLHASGLRSGVRYALETQVDDAIYTVAGYAADARGELAIDTTLAQFAEGVCVGKNFDAPRATNGHHRIKFWIKRDGSPASGTMPGVAASAAGAQLACHGNGDGDYQYVLLEDQIADFTGTTSHDSTR